MPVQQNPNTVPAEALFNITEVARSLDLSEMPDGTFRGKNPFIECDDGDTGFVLSEKGNAHYLREGSPPLKYTRAQVLKKSGVSIGGSAPSATLIEQTQPAQTLENKVFASGAANPKFISKDVASFLWAFVNGGAPNSALNVPASVFGPLDDPARRIFDAARALYLFGEWVTPDSVAASLLKSGDESEFGSDTLLWQECARIVLADLTTAPKGVSNQTTPTALADSLAHKLDPDEPKRKKKDEPTPNEIFETAEAVKVEVAGAAVFREFRAEEIPRPALLTGEKPEYEQFQLRELLYPDWGSVTLDSEAAHAERAISHIGRDIAHCPELGFLHFKPESGFWRRDDKEGSVTAAKLAALAPVVRSESAALLRMAATLASVARDTDARAMSRAANSLLNHVRNIEKQSFLRDAGKFIAAHKRTEIEQFSPTAWKFAFKNKVFARGHWRPARREDFLLHSSPVEMDWQCDRAEWDTLRTRMSGGDPELERTMQDVAAYCLSGSSSLRALFWLYGGKGTGKSTFCELLQTLLAGASMTIDTALLQDSSSRERLGASLWNRRAVFVAEAGNKRIDAELLKMLSGGDRLAVRFHYKEAFTAIPSHALLLAANDAPRMDAYDDALKDRVMALPFVHRLGDGPPIQFLGHKRIEDARRDPNSALLRGFAVWTAEGLNRLYGTQTIYRAPAVDEATARFWQKTDPLTPFWETVSDAALRFGLAKSSLRADYERYCEEEKLRPYGRDQWARACLSRGLVSERRGDEKRTHIWKL